jgi:hypothetical protein
MPKNNAFLIESGRSYSIFFAAVKNSISYLVLASIFLTGNGFAGSAFTFYWYYPAYLLLLLYWLILYYSFNRKIFGVFLILLAHSAIILILRNGYGADLVVKQLANIFFSIAVFYYFIKHEKYDLIEIFRKYILIAKIVAIIGFVQVILFLFNTGDLFLFLFPFESNISYRFQSVTLEPSFISYTFAPIVFLSLFNLFRNQRLLIGKRWSFLFLFAYVLTFSAIAYIAIILSLTLLYLHRLSWLKAFFGVLVFSGIFLLAYLIYAFVPLVKVRIDDTIYGFRADITSKGVYRQINLSTYALLSNLYVTKQSLKESPLLGKGLGTHELAYDRILPEDMQNYFELNRTDANSMALRLLTETGYIGLGLFCFFLICYRVRIKGNYVPDKEVFWILNNGILIMFLLCLLRSGHYTIHGRILFLMIYYFSYRFIRDEKNIGYFSYSTT